MVNENGIKTRLCPGCITEKPFRKFRRYKSKGNWFRSRYCKECEAWYFEHEVQRSAFKWDEYVLENFFYNAY